MDNVEQTTKVYRSAKELRKDAAKMQKEGWRIVSQASSQPRSGIGRIIMTGGLGALVFKPKPELTTVYERRQH